MWSLIPVQDEVCKDRLRLLVGKKYTLGRTAVDFIINNDKSISRVHATLEVTHPDTNVSHPHKQPLFTIRDDSRFGTVVREQKLSNTEQLIKSGDIVKFGTVDSIYSALYEPYVVTTSCLDPGSKKQTKTLVTRLGGHAVSDWRRECQLLVMTSLSVTVKVICALVSLKPIVTVQYLDKLVACIEAKTELPDPEAYTPPLAESQLNPQEVSFKKDERRKTLFSGKNFIFLNPKQFKKLNVAVELAGGTPMLMEEGTDDNEDDILVEQTTCVMHADPNDTSNQLSQNAHEWVKHVFKVLRKHGRRLIPDCELGFAVLYCSTERYCNPRMDATPTPHSQNSLPSQLVSQQRAPQSSQHRLAYPAPAASKARAKAAEAEPSFSGTQVKPEPMSHLRQASSLSELPVTPPRAKKPLKAPGTPPITKFFSMKREREDEGEDEGEDDTMSARKLFRGAEETETRRRSQRSPSPCPEASNASGNSLQPPMSPTATPTKRQSLSPSPPPPRKRAALKAVEPISPTTPPRRSPRSRSPSPTPNPASNRAQRSTPKSRSPTPTPTQRRPITRSPSPTAVPDICASLKAENSDEEEVDEFSSFDPRARRRQRQNKELSQINSGMKNKPGSPVVKTTKPITNSSPQRNGLTETNAEKDRSSPESSPKMMKIKTDVDAAYEDHQDVDGVRHAPDVLPGGFLTTYRTKQGQGDERSNENAHADSKTVTVMTRLTVPRRQRADVNIENNNTINGKSVRNFKKFKKVVGVGGQGLPRIIGGTDLKTHLNDPREVDAWFDEERQTQKVQETQQKEADDMFNWQPRNAAKKKSVAKRR